MSVKKGQIYIKYHVVAVFPGYKRVTKSDVYLVTEVTEDKVRVKQLTVGWDGEAEGDWMSPQELLGMTSQHYDPPFGSYENWPWAHGHAAEAGFPYDDESYDTNFDPDTAIHWYATATEWFAVYPDGTTERITCG